MPISTAPIRAISEEKGRIVAAKKLERKSPKGPRSSIMI